MNKLQKMVGAFLMKAAGFPPWLAGLFSIGGVSSSGVSVTPENAMQCSAIWACVRIRARMIGHFPLYVYRKTPKGVEILDQHPLYPMLHESPNALMTSMEWREAMSLNFDIFGNAFAEKIKLDSAGPVVALNLLPSRNMRIKIQDDVLTYEYHEKNGRPRILQPDDVLHWRDVSWDGITGLNKLEQQRNVIGMTIAQQEFQSALYKNGGYPSGVLEHPSKLNAETVSRIRDTWEKTHSGVTNTAKTAILWDGMKYNAVGLTPQTAQLLESRQFQLSEIARMFGVPPHLIADLVRATFSNIEQQGIEFVTYGLAPDCVRFEQRIKKSVLNDPKRDLGVYCKFNVAALMRGDAAARATFYASMVQNGIMTRDECRELEELTRRGGAADELTVQSNMLDLDKLAKLAAGETPKQPQLPVGGGDQ